MAKKKKKEEEVSCCCCTRKYENKYGLIFVGIDKGTYICDDCVDICNEVIKEENKRIDIERAKGTITNGNSFLVEDIFEHTRKQERKNFVNKVRH